MFTNVISKAKRPVISEQELTGQPAVEEKLPKIGRHVSPHVVNYQDGRALLVIRLSGMAFESLSEGEISTRFDQRNRVIAAAAKSKGNRLAFWKTLQRRRINFTSKFTFKSAFMRQFASAYLQRFTTGNYYENVFYISVLLKYDDLAEGVKELEDLGEQLTKSFSSYDPEILGTYQRNGILFSDVYKFLGTLINGVEEEMPVSATPAYELIPNAWLHFGYEIQEIRTESRTRFAVNYDMKDFPDSTKNGMFDKILELPAEFIFTQGFKCLGILESKKAVSSQANKLKSVRDKAGHQLQELEQAEAYLSTGELAFGEYHGVLTVYGDTEKQAGIDGTLVTTCFIAQCGTRFMRATTSAPYTYVAHVPGAKWIPRPMPKASRNLAASFSLHNYSSGKSSGNPIGDGSAVIPLQTVSGSLYSFNFHYSREGEDNQGEKLAGHTMFLGTTGSGKTTTETTLIGFTERFDTKIFALDKDEGLKLFIAGLSGLYLTVREGEPTGLAPFQLPDTPETREFLYELVTVCGRDDKGKVSAEEGGQIKVAVDAVLGLDMQHRQFSRLLENIPNVGGNCLAARLGKWCHAANGRFAWALDNASGSNMGITAERVVGFDVSDFLKPGYEPTEPVLAYLLHLKKLMQRGGGLLSTVIAEFHVPAMYPTTAAMMFDVLKTGRKRDEYLVMDSQSPEDAIKSPIFDAIRDLTITKIFLPNPSAEYESYQRCGLTRKEFDQLKGLEVDSRTFLIKQGNQSCFAKLDLYGMDDAISILSGNTENVAIFNEVVEEVGVDPEVWMPEFQQRRRGKRQRRRAHASN
jgi:type IV secretion system protein VirB4